MAERVRLGWLRPRAVCRASRGNPQPSIGDISPRASRGLPRTLRRELKAPKRQRSIRIDSDPRQAVSPRSLLPRPIRLHRNRRVSSRQRRYISSLIATFPTKVRARPYRHAGTERPAPTCSTSAMTISSTDAIWPRAFDVVCCAHSITSAYQTRSDYRNIPWRSTRFDEEALTTAVATLSRAENALEQLERRGGRKALAFCVSQRHADFMANFFRTRGKRVESVHSGQTSAPRTRSLERLQAGELDIVCAVDMFNEGVDMPDLDTVMMLRPTESKILWLQQFGRGLRLSDPSKRLKVIDYIGNHRTFLLKPQTLFNLPAGDQNVQNLLEKIQAGTADLPPGCHVTYDLKSIEILKGLLRVSRSPAESLKTYVHDFVALHGVRPTALERAGTATLLGQPEQTTVHGSAS